MTYVTHELASLRRCAIAMLFFEFDFYCSLPARLEEQQEHRTVMMAMTLVRTRRARCVGMTAMIRIRTRRARCVGMSAMTRVWPRRERYVSMTAMSSVRSRRARCVGMTAMMRDPTRRARCVGMTTTMRAPTDVGVVLEWQQWYVSGPDVYVRSVGMAGCPSITRLFRYHLVKPWRQEYK